MNNTFLALDFDGVLNSNEWVWSHPERDDEFEQIDPSRVEIMNSLVDRLDCKIVISSAWRILHSVGELRRGLMSKNATFAKRIIGKTDNLNGPKHATRGAQIQRWMDKYPDHKLVIIDDSTDMGHLLPFLVKTNPDTGIIETDIEKAIEVVGNQ